MSGRIAAAYTGSGPILDVLVGVSERLARALREAGLPVPPRIRLPFIIDTGAGRTMLSDGHIRTLGIPEKGFTDVCTSTTTQGPARCATFDTSLLFSTPGDGEFQIAAVQAIGTPLVNHSMKE